jgi:hypothetical protein
VGYATTPTSFGQAGYTAVVDVHFGAGAFSAAGLSSVYQQHG